MSNENSGSSLSQVSFCCDVPKVSALDKCFSDEFIVRGASWKVGLHKGRYIKEQCLGVTLICANIVNSSDWSHIAYLSVELQSFGGEQHTRKMYTLPFVFNCNEPEWNQWLLKWNDLLDPTKQFVSKDTLSLKVEIIVAANQSELIFENIGSTCAESGSTKCRLTIENADRLLAIRSPQISFQNATWYLVVFKDHKNQYGICLECRNVDNPEYSIEVKVTINLVAIKPGGKSIEHIETKRIKHNQNLYVKSFVSQGDVFDQQNGLANDEQKSIVIEVELELNQPTGGVENSANNMPAQQRLEQKCAICYQGFEGEPISLTPCGHLFCLECICIVRSTIKIHKVCPVCRSRVVTKRKNVTWADLQS